MAEKMMQESLKQFFQMASQDLELQSKLKAAPNREAYVRLVVELGKEKGYSFTSDQVVTALDTAASAAANGDYSYSRELDESELEAVAGGAPDVPLTSALCELPKDLLDGKDNVYKGVADAFQNATGMGFPGAGDQTDRSEGNENKENQPAAEGERR